MQICGKILPLIWLEVSIGVLSKVKVVLIGTTHSGNIGSVARAMKTMGLSQLVLVDPQTDIDGKSTALAAGASDILAQAQIVSTLDEATSDCGLVLATSARQRGMDWPILSPRAAGEKVSQELEQYPVAIVFGRESSGLTNEELHKADYHVVIDANPDYSSLNLAQAVQVLCYEIRTGYLNALAGDSINHDETYPLHQDLDNFYQHLEKTLLETGFIVKNHPGKVMMKLRRLFSRARPEALELNILRGILSSFDKQKPHKTS